jgi:hypothetical protein
VSLGSTADIDPQFWSIEDGKLYLNLDEKVNKLWVKDIPGNIKKANKNWPTALEK